MMQLVAAGGELDLSQQVFGGGEQPERQKGVVGDCAKQVDDYRGSHLMSTPNPSIVLISMVPVVGSCETKRSYHPSGPMYS